MIGLFKQYGGQRGNPRRRALPPAAKCCCVQLHYFHLTADMDKRKLAALAKKNAAKSGGASKIPKGFGKKYDGNLSDDPTDEATIKQRAESERFFAEMKKRDF